MVGAGWRQFLRCRRSRHRRDRSHPAQLELTSRPLGSLMPRRWVRAQFPADIGGGTYTDAGDIVRAAWTPGVHIVIADLTATVSWTTASLHSLRRAHRDLASQGTELRMVVWSSELYTALQATGVTPPVLVFANLESAVRAPAGRRFHKNSRG